MALVIAQRSTNVIEGGFRPKSLRIYRPTTRYYCYVFLRFFTFFLKIKKRDFTFLLCFTRFLEGNYGHIRQVGILRKIISRLISITFSLFADPNITDLLQSKHSRILAGIGVVYGKLSIFDIYFNPPYL